ncbi:MAG: aldehyde dehydrogenase family protein, partial [Thermoanaerobaculia bacterium]
MPVLEIRKTYKLFVGGEFVRSESGHYDEARDGRGRHRANLCRASRKDLRDAVLKARAVQGKWAGQSGYLRGQILYRMAEMMESRVPAFEAALRGSGATATAARREVRATIDRIVHFAGWSDKYQA